MFSNVIKIIPQIKLELSKRKDMLYKCKVQNENKNNILLAVAGYVFKVISVPTFVLRSHHYFTYKTS